MHVKKGDTVYILAGKDKGKTGKILRALPSEGKVVVEGINVRKMRVKARAKGAKFEVVDMALPIHVSNVRKGEKKATPKKAVKK
ncbi:MAG: 50S ribosomal protein L24 [Parcubacteria group bacterium]